MIITKLIGGLGNQMFQYAAGRKLAYTNKTTLKLDITGYEHQDEFATKRQYMLSIFKIVERFATQKEITRLINGLFWSKKSYVKERGLDFNSNVLNLRGDIYLEGYWQSEKYFVDIAGIIRKDFAFKFPPDRENKNVLRRIASSNSVSLHVRRGDYVKDTATTKFHGICGPDYYRQGLKLITEKVKNPTLFVFSDEPDWVKKNMKFGHRAVYVTHNAGKADHEDLRLMSACQHNIIVNSSFSWWGAWLNKNPDKIVVAPKRWFAAQDVKVEDRLPDSWVVI